MSRTLLSVCLLAAHAVYAQDLLQPQAFRALAAAAATTAAGLQACATIDVILSSCLSAGALETDVPFKTEAACLCCAQGTYIANQYSSCQSYVKSAAPKETDAYSVASLGYGICTRAGNVCSASAFPSATRTSALGAPASTTATPTATPTAISSGSSSAIASGRGSSGSVTRIVTSVTAGPRAAACTSLVDEIEACSSAVPGWDDASGSKKASCLCYDSSGKFNTDFDDMASSCEPYAKTALTEDYSAVSVLQTFCEVFSPATASTSAKSTLRTTGTSAAATPTTTAVDGGSNNPPSSTAGAQTVFVTRTSTGLAAPSAPTGAVATLANLVTMVMSFFFLL